MEFLGIGLPELVVILVLTMIVVGPKRLPETAAQIARAIREFRRYSSGITSELNEAVKDLEREYGDLRGEWKALSDEMRQKAAAIGGSLTGIVDEAHEKLQIEAPKTQETEATEPSPQVAGPGDGLPTSGMAAQAGAEGGEAEQSPAAK
ncbi:MAG: twin-arginine translocase TatA/TatE family subunit [Dehalococcoidia bacterium]|jgi:Tat protein translocase TatB subunit